MSKLERIDAFINVVEEDGFSAAAKKQKISTAAISRLVSRLESDLNVQLLNRTTRRLVLTDIGALYYQQCKNAIAGLKEAESLIANNQSQATGSLSIVSNRYFAITHLIPRLADFMAANSNLQITVDLAERFPNFDKENVDILFGVSMDGSDNLVRKKITVTRYVCCASQAYLYEHGVPSVPHDLTKHRYITHGMRQPSDKVQFKNQQSVIVQPVLSLNDSFAMRECAIQGMGIVKLHDYVVADALEDGRLIEILSAYQDQQLSVYLYYQQNRYLQPKIRKFIDFFTS